MAKKETQSSSVGPLVFLVVVVLIAASGGTGAVGPGLGKDKKKEAKKPAKAAPASPGQTCKGSTRACLIRYRNSGRVQFTTLAGCDTPGDFRRNSSIDSRVWRAILAMANRTGGIRVSCLRTGHSKYVAGRPGVVSDHFVGDAVDVDMVRRQSGGGWIKIDKSMQYGFGRSLMAVLTDACMDAGSSQAISLLDFPDRPGQRSFAMSNHSGHIHCGF